MPRSELEHLFLGQLRVLAPELADGMAQEHAFALGEGRKWRFDFAWPEARVALEVDGGQWRAGGGRHNTDADRWKRAWACALGWRVLAFSGQQLTEAPDLCLDLLRRALTTARPDLTLCTRSEAEELTPHV